jgi:hypothetical protein
MFLRWCFGSVENGYSLSSLEIRPHEFLNYFTFEKASKESQNFSIDADFQQSSGETPARLGFLVNSPKVAKALRKNAVLSIVLDRSGSMAGENRMQFIKSGLKEMLVQLKNSDVVNFTLFNNGTCSPIENFVVGTDDPAVLLNAINSVRPSGGTDLHAGLLEGYRLAEKTNVADKNNRVILITDAQANEGVVDEKLLGKITTASDKLGIGLSGIGVGTAFNDKLFDKLTEDGKGAFLFVSSEKIAKRVFGDKFTALIEPFARNVRFKVNLPTGYALKTHYAEEAALKKQDIKPLHFQSNSSQFYFMDLQSKKSSPLGKELALEVTYTTADDAKEMKMNMKFDLAALAARQSTNIAKAALIMDFVRMVQSHRQSGKMSCSAELVGLRKQYDRINKQDGELDYLLSMGDKFCEKPVHNVAFSARAPNVDMNVRRGGVRFRRGDVQLTSFCRPPIGSGISREELEAVVKANFAQIRACAERHLHNEPPNREILFNIEARMLIGKSGRITSASAMNSSAMGAGFFPVARCAEGAVKRWKFPAPRGDREQLTSCVFHVSRTPEH